MWRSLHDSDIEMRNRTLIHLKYLPFSNLFPDPQFTSICFPLHFQGTPMGNNGTRSPRPTPPRVCSSSRLLTPMLPNKHSGLLLYPVPHVGNRKPLHQLCHTASSAAHQIRA